MFGIATAYAAEGGIHVKLAPYIVGEVMGVPITATLITTWVVMGLLILTAFLVKKQLAAIPGKLQSVFELIIGGVFDYMADVLDSRDMARKYFPVVATIFIFILSLNWFGLLPGVSGAFMQSPRSARTASVRRPAGHRPTSRAGLRR